MSPQGNLPSLKPAEFARAGEKLSGTLAASDLVRLRQQLAGQETAGQSGQVHYEVRGVVTERGHDALDLDVRGTVELACQRCLEPVQVAFDSHRRIIFAAQADTLGSEYDAEDTDVVEAVGTLEVVELIEDEVLLSLPMAPMHAAGACQAARADENERAESPFAALAQWARKDRTTGA